MIWADLTRHGGQGRLYQVEYAMEAISNAGAAIGILSKEGVVLIAEKKITSKVGRVCNAMPHSCIINAPSSQLLDTHAVGVRREKMYKLDEHVSCAVAGLTGMGSSDYQSV